MKLDWRLLNVFNILDISHLLVLKYWDRLMNIVIWFLLVSCVIGNETHLLFCFYYWILLSKKNSEILYMLGMIKEWVLVHVFEYDLVYDRVQNSWMRMVEIGIDDFSVFWIIKNTWVKFNPSISTNIQCMKVRMKHFLNFVKI